MSVAIGFHGRRDSRFKVETRHIAEGTGVDPDPYDQIKIRGDGHSGITLYISREQTQRLREALTRLCVDYPVPEQARVATTKDTEITVEFNDVPRDGTLRAGAMIEVAERYNEGTSYEVIRGATWISPLDFGFDDGRDREVEVEIPVGVTA